jgi:hypothetical protein
MFCRSNHIDGCGWEYENWEDPGHARSRWYDDAITFLSKAKKFINHR